MNEKLQNIITDTPSSWIKEAKRRKRWNWLRKPIFKIEVKYLRLKRKYRERF